MKRSIISVLAALAIAGISFIMGRSYPHHHYVQLGQQENVLYEQSTGRACRPYSFPKPKPDVFDHAIGAPGVETAPLSELTDLPPAVQHDAPRDPLPQCGAE